jgi:cell surface protein SprA
MRSITIILTSSTIRQYWRERLAMEHAKHGTGNRALDKYLNPKLNVDIQGFDKIFGTNVIDIKPQGSAELIFGLNINRTEDYTLPKNQQRIVTFDFDEKIQMGVTGQIGDKMKLGINYNTEATFDFENQSTIEYTGHEDEILQKIEAGNVSLPLNGTLIQGSTTLFGLKNRIEIRKFIHYNYCFAAKRRNRSNRNKRRFGTYRLQSNGR